MPTLTLSAVEGQSSGSSMGLSYPGGTAFQTLFSAMHRAEDATLHGALTTCDTEKIVPFIHKAQLQMDIISRVGSAILDATKQIMAVAA